MGERRKRLTNEEKFELLKMCYKDGVTDFTGTKYEGYNVKSIRANLRAAYDAGTLKMEPELLKKFEGEYFLQREKTPRVSDEDKYQFLIEFYEKYPDVNRSEEGFTKKYEEGETVRKYINHLQVKHNRGKDTLTQEQLNDLIGKHLLRYSPSELKEICETYNISEDCVDSIMQKYETIEDCVKEFENGDEKASDALKNFFEDRFIWKGKKDVSDSQKRKYCRLARSVNASRYSSLEDRLKLKVIDSDLIDEEIKTLTEREQDVLRRRFGLDTGESKSLESVVSEISLTSKYPITRERVRQIEAKAIRKMKIRKEIKEIMNFGSVEENMNAKKELEQDMKKYEKNETGIKEV